MASSPEIDPEPHRWEASVLTTAPSLLPKNYSPSVFFFFFYQYRDRERERQNERERLVSEGTEQIEQDHDIEMNGVDKSSQHEEPLLEKTFESSTESFDPLYDRVTRKAPDREVPPVPSTSEDGPKPEPPIYQVLRSELKTMAPSQKLGSW